MSSCAAAVGFLGSRAACFTAAGSACGVAVAAALCAAMPGGGAGGTGRLTAERIVTVLGVLLLGGSMLDVDGLQQDC